MAVRPIDGNALIEWFSPYLHTGEPIPADVVIEDIRSMPTLTPPNEPEYREYTCPNCHHTWLEDRDASDYPEYCPGCGDPLHKEENEPLTCKGDENGEQ